MTWNLIGSIWEFKIFRHREVKSFSIHHNLTWFQSILVIFGCTKFKKTRIWRNEIIHQTYTDTMWWDNSSITCHLRSRDATLDTPRFIPISTIKAFRNFNFFRCSGSSGCEIRFWKVWKCAKVNGLWNRDFYQNRLIVLKF